MKCRISGCNWPATHSQTTCTVHRYLDAAPPTDDGGRWFYLALAIAVACLGGLGFWCTYEFDRAARRAEPVDTAGAR